MNKRTNLRKPAEFISLFIIPLLIIISAFSSNNVSGWCINTLNFTAFLITPEEIIKNSDKNNDIIEENSDTITDSATDTEMTSAPIKLKSDIPDDIRELIEKAENLYASSSNDGSIDEVDYSTKNATAQYENMYFRNSTLEKEINIADYINKDIEADIIKNEPSVLLYHTYTSESYELLDRGFYTNEREVRSDNNKENVVRIGEEICSVLESKGYKTIHITECFDTQYNGAYERSRQVVSEVLRANPSIQIVLDIHRDSIYLKEGTRVKTVTEIDGDKVAQILITTGCESGNVKDFPNWEKNLVFALKLQKQLTDDYKALVRPLTITSKKMNMDLIPCALSVEIGTDANTLTEAIYSSRLFANSLSEILKECETNE